MAIEWWEFPNTAEMSANSATLHYGMSGVSDRTTARFLALGYTPLLFGYLYRTDCQIREVGPGLYNIDITWGTKDKQEPTEGVWKWRFTTSGDTRHVTYGKAAANSYTKNGKYVGSTSTWTGISGAADDHINHKMAINVTDDGDVDGVDIPDRAFGWTEEHDLLLSSYSFLYAQTLGAYKGFVNSATFRGMAAGTVRFEDSDGGPSDTNPEYLHVVYNFRYSPNVTGATVGDITGIDKEGWEYAWVRYEQAVDDVAKKTTPIPRQVDVIKVIDSFDFSLLGIGTAAPTDWPIV